MSMAAILINAPSPFLQIFSHPLIQGFRWSLKKIDPVITREKSFKGVTERMDDGRTTTDGIWS